MERGGCVLREFGEGGCVLREYGEGWLCTEGIWRGMVELNLIKTITFTADSTHKRISVTTKC